MLEEGKEKVAILYKASFKSKVVEQINQKKSSINDISYKYKIPPSTIRSWLFRSAKVENKELIIKMELVMKEQEEKIKQLQAALSDAHLKLMVYEKMIEIAKDEHGVEFKKNSITGEYELVNGKKISQNSAE